MIIPLLLATYLLGFQSDTDRLPIDSDTLSIITPEKYHNKEAMVVANILERYHYRKTELNDSLSSVVFDNYLANIDPNKLYFLESDIENMEKYRLKFDDFIKEGDLDAAYNMFNLFRKNFYERNHYVYELLDQGFDFSIEESYQSDRDKADYPQTLEDAHEVWRKIVKDQALSLKLTDKDWPEIADILKKRYNNLEKNIAQVESDDIFQLYMNSLSESFDPHTSYFSPKTKENFKISMSQSLEGIGARLQMDNDYVKVVEIIAGGPAFKSKLLHKDDRIVGVAQDDDGEMVDVIGWRLDDVVQLIRGPKGSKVRLSILPAEMGNNALPIEIELIRDKVNLEDLVPKKEIITMDKEGHEYKFGVITIPSFYMDYEELQKGNKNYNSTTRDVRKLINELEQEDIDGLVIDLRLNGGGSLTEAIELSGLFIPDGPVVQVRNANGSIDVATDPDPDFVYSGPLAVLVNRFSASASEIFAGAIQDYQRGVIIGEQTFGKGTVQNLLDLGRFMSDQDQEYGQMKITLAKFYRITGSSTQHRGVLPDIDLPSAFSAEEFGESSQPSALPWDQIKAADHQVLNLVSRDMLEKIKQKHAQRMSEDPDIQELKQEVQEIKQERQETIVSLNEVTRRKEQQEAQAKSTRMNMAGSVDQEIKEVRTESELEDTYLKESVNVLADLIAFSIG